MAWIERGGFDWHIDDVVEGPITFRTVGATIGYGLVDEPMECRGTLQVLAEALRVALSRPIETPSGIAHPHVQVTVGSDTTHIVISADPDALLPAWSRLAPLLAGELPLDLGAWLPVVTWGWPIDAFARTGANAFALALTVEDDAPDPDESAVHRLRSRLHPVDGDVNWVFMTNDPSLADAAGPRRAGALPPPAPPRAAGLPQAGTMRATPGGGLYFTTVLPRTLAGIAASFALVSHFTASLGARGVRTAQPWASLRGFGAQFWLDVNDDVQVPGDGTVGPALTGMLATPVSDLAIDLAIAQTLENGELQRWQRELRVHALDEGDIDRAAVRRALSVGLQSVHVPDDGRLGPLPGFPRLRPHVPERLPGPHGEAVRELLVWAQGSDEDAVPQRPADDRSARPRPPWLVPAIVFLVLAALALVFRLLVFPPDATTSSGTPSWSPESVASPVSTSVLLTPTGPVNAPGVR